MRPTRRTQPYRIGPRAPGPVLDAIQRGRAPGMPVSGADFQNQLRAMQGGPGRRDMQQIAADPRDAQRSLQSLIQKRMQVGPTASADVRGVPGMQGGSPMAVDHWPAGAPDAVDHWPGLGGAPTVPMSGNDRQAQAFHALILQALRMQQRRPRGNGGAAAPVMAHI